jgi:hypothetical protein
MNQEHLTVFEMKHFIPNWKKILLTFADTFHAHELLVLEYDTG